MGISSSSWEDQSLWKQMAIKAELLPTFLVGYALKIFINMKGFDLKGKKMNGYE